MEEKHSGK
jgi:hypothetical protein